nr:MAG TPA: hypothetical protein [Caudoviricetes sp.]
MQYGLDTIFRRSDVMKIKEVNTNYILFDNGSRINAVWLRYYF